MSPFTGTIETTHGPLTLGGRTLVMGILNVTPDSFSDGGRYLDPQAAVARGLQLAADGADVIDIGGESTRPGSDPVTADEQCRRVVPVIAKLRDRGLTIPISIDTRSAMVAAAALDAGADIVNDVSALRDDPGMSETVAQRRCPVVLMHMQGAPKSMQEKPRYTDVVAELLDFFRERMTHAEKAGIEKVKIILDPGIGFGKSTDHNWEILRRLRDFHQLDRPILVGASRKRFLRALAGNEAADAADSRPVLAASIAAAIACVQSGVQLVRVHDVKESRAAIAVTESVKTV